jgi:hypothetical protein
MFQGCIAGVHFQLLDEFESAFDESADFSNSYPDVIFHTFQGRDTFLVCRDPNQQVLKHTGYMTRKASGMFDIQGFDQPFLDSLRIQK